MNHFTAKELSYSDDIRFEALTLTRYYAKPADMEAAKLALLWLAFEREAQEQAIPFMLTIGVGGGKALFQKLADEIVKIDAEGHLPDGDGVNIPTALWAEGWAHALIDHDLNPSGREPSPRSSNTSSRTIAPEIGRAHV